jgi:tetratricopeptide (TPR) repeat protein
MTARRFGAPRAPRAGFATVLIGLSAAFTIVTATPQTPPTAPSPNMPASAPAPAATPAPTDFAETMRQANALRASRQYDQAHRLYSQAVKLNAASPDAWFGLSIAAAARGNDEETRTTMETVVKLRPNEPIWFFERAREMWMLARYGDVIRDGSVCIAAPNCSADAVSYAAFAAALAARRIGPPTLADGVLASTAKAAGADPWRAALHTFLTGLLTPDELLKRARTNDQLTEAHAYIGMTRSVAGQRAEALNHLGWVEQRGTRDRTEYRMALAELARLREDWRYSQTITLDTSSSGADVPDDVTRYPLAVQLDKSRFDFSQAQANGADLRFFTSDGAPLAHAIELWDPQAGQAAIWVLMDVVKGNRRDQSIVMRWGHTTAPNISDTRKVFTREDGFVGVWHLNEEGNTAADGYRDSSAHDAHGTGIGLAPGARVDARIGKGVHLDNPTGQNTARWIRVGGDKAAAFNPGQLTVSIWALAHSFPIRSYETMIAKGDTSWTLQRVQYPSGQGFQTCVRAVGYHLCAYNFAAQRLVTNEWLHFMVVLDEPEMKLYINGQLNATRSAGPWEKGAHDLGIGNQTQVLGGRRQWDGILDEARVMQGARSASWAKLDFESQRASPRLLKFGSVNGR